MAGLSLFPDGAVSLYRIGHTILAREGVLLLDTSAAVGESQRQMPSTLLPSPLPRALYERVLAAQPAINRLYHRVSRDEAFLEETLRSVLGDEFTRRLWEVFLRTREARRGRPAVGNVPSLAHAARHLTLRCRNPPQRLHAAGRGHEAGGGEYHLCLPSNDESEGGGGAQRHSCTFQQVTPPLPSPHTLSTNYCPLRSPSPPKNDAADRTAETLARARDAYIRAVPAAVSPAVLFLSPSNNANFYDQNYLRAKLQTLHQVPVLWRSLQELEGAVLLRESRVFVGETEVRHAGVNYVARNYPCVGLRVLLQIGLRPVPLLGPGMGNQSSAGRKQGTANSRRCHATVRHQNNAAETDGPPRDRPVPVGRQPWRAGGTGRAVRQAVLPGALSRWGLDGSGGGDQPGRVGPEAAERGRRQQLLRRAAG